MGDGYLPEQFKSNQNLNQPPIVQPNRQSSKNRTNLWQSRENLRHEPKLADKKTHDDYEMDQHNEYRPVPKARTTSHLLSRHSSRMQQNLNPGSNARNTDDTAFQQTATNQPTHLVQSLQASARPPATYRLISEALKKEQKAGQQNYPTQPIPAQRVMTTGQAGLTFDRYQHEQAYSKPTARFQLVGQKQDNTSAAVNSRTKDSNADEPQSTINLPSYEEFRSQQPRLAHPDRSQLSVTQKETLAHAPASLANNSAIKPTAATCQPAATSQPGESCCGSSNPDSGYGGQQYDFYTNQSSLQSKVVRNQTVEEYDTSWYSKRLQDASRKINNGHLRPYRTMTSDV